MTDMWPEIELCATENRRELVLKGNELKQRIAEADGLPPQLYDLKLLNFLEVNALGVKVISERIGNLNNLTQLFLRKNDICKVPDGISELKVLKILDLFENLITELPSEIGGLENLHTLNLANNQLSKLPDSFANLSNLAVLRLDKNKFTEFPSVLYEGNVSGRLAELYASYNQIEDISDLIEKMTLIKVLDVSDNELKELTQAIGGCLKLKQTNFKNNPLKDRRLKKLIDQDSNQKSILDYIRSRGRRKCADGQTKAPAPGKGGRKKMKDQKAQAINEEQEKALMKYTIQVMRLEDKKGKDPFRIIVCPDVVDIRPFIVGCIIKYMDLEPEDRFKSFITLQTRLHDEICQKRMVATIATHDVKFIPESVVCYDAEDPTTFKIRPLGRKVEISALELYRRLCKEADDARKDKKRNQVSGIHKYISLLKGKDKFAYLRRNSDNCVISLPPLTNSEVTKITTTTSDIFVEVTGIKSLNQCKAVLDEMLKRLVELGFYSYPPKEFDFYDDSSDEEEQNSNKRDTKCLIVQQVRVETEEGNIRVIYPSRTDLAFNSKEIKISRPT